MTQRTQWRRQTAAFNETFTGALAEVTVDTDIGWLRVHDGSTPGGSIANPVFNAQWFGAREGATPAVNVSAIQDAIDECHAASTGSYARGGGTVLLPPGIFEIEEPLIPREKVNYKGMGSRASIIKALGPTWAFERVSGSDIRLMASFRHLGIWGDGDPNGVNEDGEALGGIHLERCHYTRFHDVDIRNFSAAGGMGMSLGRCFWYKLDGLMAEFCHTACVDLYAVSSVGCNQGQIGGQSELIGNNMPECVGLAANLAQNLRIRGTDIDGGGGGIPGLNGVSLTACEGVSIRDVYNQLWGAEAITLAGGSNKRVTIKHSVINGTTEGSILNIIELNSAGTPNTRIEIAHNRFPDAGALRTCVRIGNATKVRTYDNDPDTSIMLDQRSGSFDNTQVSALVGSKTWNPGSILTGNYEETTVTVAGARAGDPVSVAFSGVIADTVYLNAQVQGDDTVRVILENKSGGTQDLASGTLKAVVFKQGI